MRCSGGNIMIHLEDTHTHSYLSPELFGDGPGLVHQDGLTLHGGVDEQQAVQMDARGEDQRCILKTHSVHYNFNII